jgi:sensor histidine kinase YesM
MRVWRQRLIELGFIWLVWTLVGLFFSSQVYFIFLRTERPVSFAEALSWQMACVYLLALMTPLALWLARRFRLERPHWRCSLLVHALAGVLVAVLLSISHGAIDLLHTRGPSYITFRSAIRSTLYLLDKELLIYWLIVLMSHAASYYRRYREGELRASRLETQLAQSQLQALKMQLHPHFLFNTLHSISALVHHNPDLADKMITRLGDFLRLTLENSGAQEVTLQRELEFLKCYLEIERVRFYDRLTTSIDIDPRALDCRVPNLILQPIVENAIRHGIAPWSHAGRIEIRAERAGGMLRMQVKDSGPGLAARAATSNLRKGGLGLANTRARLDQLYGAAHRFELTNDPKGGLVVTLEIPSFV